MPENNEMELKRLEEKIDAIWVSVEKTRKYFLATMILTIAVFVLPLIGLIFVIPSMIASYTSLLGGM